MRYKRIRSIIMAGVLGMLNVLFAYSQPADSLGYYLELAARNNPQINADFSLYKASLEKVPQAGAVLHGFFKTSLFPFYTNL